MKVLIMGLPGSGKTTLADAIQRSLYGCAVRVNADDVRTRSNDWDFSPEGRNRQAQRMGLIHGGGKMVIADFVCPTAETMRLFGPVDLVIWMDTILSSRFYDTNVLFKPPTNYHVRIRTWAPHWAGVIAHWMVTQADQSPK